MSEGMEAPAGGEAAAPATPAAPIDRDAEEHELVVNGQPRKVTFAEMKKQLSKEWAADKRLEEAAVMKKDIENWFQELKRDGPKALKKAGLNPKEFFKATMEEEARLGLMSPEEREREEIRAENAALKQENELTKKEKQELWQKQQDELVAPEVERKLVDAAKKVGLPGDPWALEKLINEIEDAEKVGLDISFEQAAILANHRLKIQGQKDRQNYYKNIDGATLAADLGPETIQKLWEWSKQQAQASAAPKVVQRNAPRQPASKGPQYFSEIDFDKRRR